MHPFDAAFVQ